MTFKLDLSKYGDRKEILISVIFSKIKSFLEEKQRAELFGYIEYIKDNNGVISIKTGKPIVNAELKMYNEELSKIILDVSFVFGLRYKEIKIIFK